jgi:6-phosphofructokinase
VPGRTAVVAHGGGPTAVLNASLAGLVDACRSATGIRVLLGARFGVNGLVEDDFIDLLGQSPDVIAAIGTAPGSAIGSSRRRLTGVDAARLLDIFRRRGVRWFFYTGGNGSMGTALEIARHARDARYDLQVIGIPKTIDNDLEFTDHTPGYASAARFFAHAARDIGADNRALPSPVCILETLGRNAGWIAAATSLARSAADDPPHLIYFPERRLPLDRIVSDVERVYRRLGFVLVAVCEGQTDPTGSPFGADMDRADVPIQRLASNLGHTLAGLLAARLGVRARAEKPGLLGRSCEPLASAIDRRESYECGQAAVAAALAGETDVMVALRRESNAPYRSSTFLTPLEQVARRERTFPPEWIAPEGNDVLPAFRDYASPLVGEVPSLAWPR